MRHLNLFEEYSVPPINNSIFGRISPDKNGNFHNHFVAADYESIRDIFDSSFYDIIEYDHILKINRNITHSRMCRYSGCIRGSEISIYIVEDRKKSKIEISKFDRIFNYEFNPRMRDAGYEVTHYSFVSSSKNDKVALEITIKVMKIHNNGCEHLNEKRLHSNTDLAIIQSDLWQDEYDNSDDELEIIKNSFYDNFVDIINPTNMWMYSMIEFRKMESGGTHPFSFLIAIDLELDMAEFDRIFTEFESRMEDDGYKVRRSFSFEHMGFAHKTIINIGKI